VDHFSPVIANMHKFCEENSFQNTKMLKRTKCKTYKLSKKRTWFYT